MVECGFGVAALPEIAAGTVRQPGIVERLLTGPVAERSIGLVTLRHRSLSPAAAELAEAVRRHRRRPARRPPPGPADAAGRSTGATPCRPAISGQRRDHRRPGRVSRRRRATAGRGLRFSHATVASAGIGGANRKPCPKPTSARR